MEQNVHKTNHAAHPLAKRWICAIICLFIALDLAFFGCLQGLVWPQTPRAYAVTSEIDAEPDALQQEIERTATAYNEAVAQLAQLDQQMADNATKIQEIEANLPAQQSRGAEAMRTLYRMQSNSNELVNLILGAESLTDFLTSLNYIDHIQEKNLNDISATKAMKDELSSTRAALEVAKASASDEKLQAEQALNAAMEARAQAQARALEEARAQAAAAQAALQAEQAKQAEEAKQPDAAQEGTNNPPAPPAPPSTDSGGGTIPAPPGNVDWGEDKIAFVNEWTGRINAYLAGSPLAGQGKSFAAAAWNYGVDPRWSPAISNTESSKGAYCFLPHNAWGWGNVSWNSWEEAIDAHVRGLARGYGYTISVAAAKKYCPPNWEHWYNNTVAQMNMI